MLILLPLFHSVMRNSKIPDPQAKHCHPNYVLTSFFSTSQFSLFLHFWAPKHGSTSITVHLRS